MSKQAKIALTGLGLAALIIPVVLLMVFSSKTPKETAVDNASRTINSETINKAVKAIPSASTTVVPSPFVSTSSARPSEGSPSGTR